MHTASRAPLLAATIAAMLVASASAAGLMPPVEQNALVEKYCTVCHTDASKNGGLSLEHFDAAQAPPSLTAMMLSKLTGGASLANATAAGVDADATALVNRQMKTGAMGAAGIPIPDQATIAALIHAFAVESARANQWAVEARAPELTASILREIPTTTGARAYRLTVSCDPADRVGAMQLAWSPAPRNGTLAVSLDGKEASRFPVGGSEKMGNGSPVVTNGLAALALPQPRLPAESLTINELFPGETVVFPFAGLPNEARATLAACFAGGRVTAARR